LLSDDEFGKAYSLPALLIAPPAGKDYTQYHTTMTNTPDKLALLLKLSELEKALRRVPLDRQTKAEASAQMQELRERLPTALLVHYDLRVAKGKRAVACVVGTACGGCRLVLPRGLVSDLRRSNGIIHVCPHCGVYLYCYPDPAGAMVPVAKPIPVKKKTAAKTTPRTPGNSPL
jgi:C4-type zinc ribbon domain